MKFFKNLFKKTYKLKTKSYKKFNRTQVTITPEKITSSEKLAIITKPHTNFFAHILGYKFAQYGIETLISPYDIQTDKNKKIIFCPQAYNDLPDGYVGYQTEQTTNDRFFQPHHKDTLKKASLMMDYSCDNIKNLKPICPNTEFYHLPMTYINDFASHLIQNKLLTANDIPDDRPYDVVFYGDPRNSRRKAYLNELQKHFNVKIICGVFGMDVVRELLKAKIIVNIHYFDDAILEIGRIFEALCLGCHVVSEKSIDQHHHENLNGIVDFSEIDDINNMVEKVSHALKSDTHRDSMRQTLKSANLSKTLDENFEQFIKRYS